MENKLNSLRYVTGNQGNKPEIRVIRMEIKVIKFENMLNGLEVKVRKLGAEVI